MSFIIALHIGEGLVMASDSRITYNTTSNNVDGSKSIQLGVHFSNSTPKTFLTPSKVGISCCGDSSIKSKPITGYIESFVEEHKNDGIDTIKDFVIPYFTGLEAGLNTTFILGGYANVSGCVIQKLYRINTMTKIVEEIDTSTQGAVWSGEIDVMSRILTTVYSKTTKGKYDEIVSYPILWQYFTLQDAVDFARYAIKTTIDTMKFQSRVKTVGGSIDILVIKPTEAFWIEKRELQ
jgi:hypothetical protein